MPSLSLTSQQALQVLGISGKCHQSPCKLGLHQGSILKVCGTGGQWAMATRESRIRWNNEIFPLPGCPWPFCSTPIYLCYLHRVTKVLPCTNLNMLTSAMLALLQGWHDEQGLWCIPLTENDKAQGANENDYRPNPEHAANNVYKLPSTEKLMRYLHATLGFPTKSTLLKAINTGNLITFPGLTSDNVAKHFPESDETIKGHMKQQRQGTRCTKPKIIQNHETQHNVHTINIPPGFKSQDAIRQDIWCDREVNVHQPDRLFSHHVKQRKQIYHGRHWIRWKLHRWRGNEITRKWLIGQGLPKNMWLLAVHRCYCSHMACHG